MALLPGSKPRGLLPAQEGSRSKPRKLPGGLWIEVALPGGELEPKEPRLRNSPTPAPGGVASDASERELGESGRPSGDTRLAEPG